MSAPFQRYDPDQSFLLPPSPRDWLPAGHLAYFLIDLVGQLNLSEIYAYYNSAPVRDEKGEVVGWRPKSKRGMPAYEPRMMTTLLLYAYVTGTPSSRAVERKCVEDLAYRVIAANERPDHDTLANFRRVHLEALAGLFNQVLAVCQKAGLVKLGHVALDGTKVKANASKHKAMSYGSMVEREAKLRQEIEELMRRAEDADQAEDRKHGPGSRGDELPAELARRESRLEKIQEAKVALEAEAKAEAERVRRADAEERERREREGKPSKPGKRPEPSEVPQDKAQRNFTDPESRIMKNSDKAFIQGYNAQAAVDREHQVVVACEVTNQAADAPHLPGMVEQVKANTGRLPEEMSADAGYFSEDNVQALEQRKIEPLVAAERVKHGEGVPASSGPPAEGATAKERMMWKLRTAAGRAAYALRKITVEPVFGQIRTRGLIRFWLRGLRRVKAEWALWCTSHNVLKLFRSGWRVGGAG